MGKMTTCCGRTCKSLGSGGSPFSGPLSCLRAVCPTSTTLALSLCHLCSALQRKCWPLSMAAGLTMACPSQAGISLSGDNWHLKAFYTRAVPLPVLFSAALCSSKQDGCRYWLCFHFFLPVNQSKPKRGSSSQGRNQPPGKVLHLCWELSRTLPKTFFSSGIG